MNGALVRKWMSDNDVRPEELAVKIGVSISTIRAILAGKRPYQPTITVLAGLMGVTVDDLLTQPKKNTEAKKAVGI